MSEQRETAYIPKNIRQVGAPDFTKKIYVEDYVITYINGIFEGSEEQEKVLLLFGGEAMSGPCHYVYIRGAYEVEKRAENEAYLTGENLKSAMENAKEHFNSLPLVGWALIRQGQPMTLEEKMERTWEAYMSRIPLFFLGDLLEKEELFYWKYDGKVKAQPGYYIFYEKNKAMQEYLISKREKVRWQPEPVETNRVVEGCRTRIEETQKNNEKFRTNTLAAMVSVFLMIVVLAIGLTMLNHYEKMDAIQASVDSLLSTLSEREMESATDAVETAVVPPAIAQSTTAAPTTTRQPVTQPTTTTPTTTRPTTTTTRATTEPTATVTPRSYTVKKGETLLSISVSVYGNPNKMNEICQMNRITDPNAIFEGQELLLP